jgi:hypothetical protein
VTPKSVMPPYRYLFHQEPLKFGEKPATDALQGLKDIPAGYQVMPTGEALQLVAYLQSLHSRDILFETPPPPPPPTNAATATATNAPAAKSVTNAPAK